MGGGMCGDRAFEKMMWLRFPAQGYVLSMETCKGCYYIV